MTSTMAILIEANSTWGLVLLIGAICGSLSATVGFPVLVWQLWGRRVQRWFKEHDSVSDERMRRIEQQVSANGSRSLLPEDKRHMALADLFVEHYIDTQPLIVQYRADLQRRLDEHPEG